MREILFKGKMKTTGKWVEGNGIIQGQDGISYARWVDICDDKVRYEVIPETLSRFSGLTDKNGKKIFEGDIVKDRFGRIMEVVFRETSVKVVFRLIKTTGKEWTNNFYFAEIEEWFWADIEVIGNKWDNPELLEKDKCN